MSTNEDIMQKLDGFILGDMKKAMKEIERLRAENEMLKALLTDEYERGFEDCVKRVEEMERKQADRLEERMKPIKDALYPGIYKPHR